MDQATAQGWPDSLFRDMVDAVQFMILLLGDGLGLMVAFDMK